VPTDQAWFSSRRDVVPSAFW